MPSVPRLVTRLNKAVLNPIQGLYAPYIAPLAVIEHAGRRSGRTYSTPVVATKHGDTLYVAVLYGEESDWLRRWAGRIRIVVGHNRWYVASHDATTAFLRAMR